MISSTWNFSSNFGSRRRATATFCKAITRAETIQILEKSRVADATTVRTLFRLQVSSLIMTEMLPLKNVIIIRVLIYWVTVWLIKC